MKIILPFILFIQLATAQIKNPISVFNNNPISYTQKQYVVYKQNDTILSKKLLNESKHIQAFNPLTLEDYTEASLTDYRFGMKSTFKTVSDSIQKTYNSDSLLVKENEYVKNLDATYFLHKKRMYVYNNLKRLDSVIVFVDNFKTPTYKYAYSYTPDNNIKTVQEYRNNKLTEKYIFRYKNKKLSQKIHNAYNFGVTPSATEIVYNYTYDNNDNLISETKTVDNETAEIKYYYNTKNYIIRQELYETFSTYNSDTKTYKKQFGKTLTNTYTNHDAYGNPTKIEQETVKDGITKYAEIERSYNYKD